MLCADQNRKSFYFAIRIFLVFLKIGTFTIGGGHVMIPLIKKELIDKKCWMDDETFLENLSIAQAYPGPVAVNFAITGGYSLCGFPGIIAAVLGSILPSFIIIIIIVIFFIQYGQTSFLQAAFTGVRPAVAALIAAALYKIGTPVFKDRYAFLFFLFLLALGIFLDAHPVIIVLLGIASGFLLPEAK